jgi:hypothetical protein
MLGGAVLGSIGGATAASGNVNSPTPGLGAPGLSGANAALNGPATPQDHVLHSGETSKLEMTIPTSGTPPYTWEWLYSTDGGSTYSHATSSECTVPGGSGAAPGAIETCSFVATSSSHAGTYLFELRVTDSASDPESVTSSASSTVTVETGPAGSPSSLTEDSHASTPSSAGLPPTLDTDPSEYCTGTCTTSNWFGGTGGSGALTLTTGAANELLILEVTDSGESGPALTVSDVTDSQGSSWSQESSAAWNGAGNTQYLFYAVDHTAGADTVTLDSASGPTTATTATAILSAFTGVDTSAPIAALGAFTAASGTAGFGNVTTGVSPTTILGIVSTTNGGSAFTPTGSPAFTQSGTVNDGVATASFLEFYGATTTGTYMSNPTWTGSVPWGEEAVAVQGASPLSVTVSPTFAVLDLGQTETLTATGAGGIGTASYLWSIQSGSCPGFSASATATQHYDPSATTSNCVLTVTAKDTNLNSAQPTTPASVVANLALTAPAAPSVSATKLDVDQALTVTDSLQTTGAAPYQYEWMVTTGSGYAKATVCGTPSASGASGGTMETCSIGSNVLSPGLSYTFELKVNDSASTSTSVTSAASTSVPVKAALTAPVAPAVSSTVLDVNQVLTVTDTIPSTGTSTYDYQWMVSVNSGTFSDTTQCTVNTGTNVAAGSKTCTVDANILAVGSSYSFELEVTDSATVAESQTSPASSTVTVSSTLTAPLAPVVSATKLDVNQALTVTATLMSTGTPTYSWQWLAEVNGTGGYVATSLCSVNSGSGASGASLETCSIATNVLSVAGSTYAFKLQVSDAASTPATVTSPGSSTVTVKAALTAPARPTVSSTGLDVNQGLTVSGAIPTTGSANYGWEWMISVNGGAFAPTSQCTTNSGSGASAGAGKNCVIAAGALTAADTYELELEVSDSAAPAESQTSMPSPTVTVSTALTAPATPAMSATALDADQTLTVTGNLPSTGTAPYGWQWLDSVNGGSFSATALCSTPSGTGGIANSVETCAIVGGSLAPGSSYAFELQVTDSATTSESQSSAASPPVTIALPLTAPGAPTPSSTAIDADQTLTLTDVLPSTGTSTYSWDWFVSVNDGTDLPATECAVSSGSGASGSAVETCSISGETLTAGSSYAFELEVTDSASSAESQNSPTSATITVHSGLTPPAAPTVSATELDVNQPLTVVGTVPSNGTAPYSWQWQISVNGGLYAPATECAIGNGTGASALANETCTISGDILAAGDDYAFELQVTDSSSSPETQNSTASATVDVNSQLAAPAAPTPSASALDADQPLTVAGTIPTTGTSPYAWQWKLSMDDGPFTTATQCGVNSGTGASPGATVTCSIPGNTLAASSNYTFELRVSDSASSPESKTSAPSILVTTSSTLTAGFPTPASASIDEGQSITLTANPSGGSGSNTFQWYTGNSAAACQLLGTPITGANLSTVLAAPTSTTYYCYVVTDSNHVNDTSLAEAVTVNSALTMPGAPTVSAAALDADQSLTVLGTIPSTGTSTYSWQWRLSVDGGSFAPTSDCIISNGTGAASAAIETCSIPGDTLAAGHLYMFDFQVKDSAFAGEDQTSAASSVVNVSSQLLPPTAPSPSATALDADQTLTVVATIPSTGTSTYSWQWLIAVNGGVYADTTQCAINQGSRAAAGHVATCTIPGNTLTASTAYNFEMQVTDSASTSETTTSPASPTVTTSSALTGGSPSPDSTILDSGQSTLLTANPSGGSGGDTYQWYSGSSAAACVLLGNLIVGATSMTYPAAPSSTSYFCYVVTDSNMVNDTSLAVEVKVDSALTAAGVPAITATALDADQSLAVTGTIPSSGTPDYSWQWIVSVDGGAYGDATFCADQSGNGAIGGTVVTCTIPGATLIPGDSYSFELTVTDSSSTPESQTSATSSLVTVHSALTPPPAPTVSATALDVNQPLFVYGLLPSTGTPTFAWQWMVSIDGAGYLAATQCASNSGTDGAEGANETCAISGNSLAVGGSYTFEFEVRDDASSPVSVTSPASPQVSVRSTLIAPKVQLSAAQGPVGAVYELSGSGFSANSGATVTFNSVLQVPSSCSDGDHSGSTLTTDTSGDFLCDFAVPSESAGNYSLVAEDTVTATSTVSQMFLVTVPAIAVSSTHGTAGTNLTVSGTGFSILTPLASLDVDSVAISTCVSGSLTTDAEGAFSCTFPSPTGVSAGTVTATDAGGQSASVTFGGSPAGSSHGLAWLWIGLGAVVAVLALLVLLVMGRRRSRPGSDAKKTSRPLQAESFLESESPAALAASNPVSSGSAPTAIEVAEPPVTIRTGPPTEDVALAAALDAVPLPKPVLGLDAVAPPRPLVIQLPAATTAPAALPAAPMRPVEAPLVVEPTSGAAPTVTPAESTLRSETTPAAPEESKLDFDTVLSELDTLSGEILRPAAKKPTAPVPPAGGSGTSAEPQPDESPR